MGVCVIAIKLQARWTLNCSLIPNSRDFSLLHHTQITYGALPASFPMVQEAPSQGKGAWAWSWPLTSIKCQGQNKACSYTSMSLLFREMASMNYLNLIKIVWAIFKKISFHFLGLIWRASIFGATVFIFTRYQPMSVCLCLPIVLQPLWTLAAFSVS
jgi:hypothetical protein